MCQIICFKHGQSIACQLYLKHVGFLKCFKQYTFKNITEKYLKIAYRDVDNKTQYKENKEMEAK